MYLQCDTKALVCISKARATRSSRNRELHPIPLTEPDVIVSHHTALIIQTIPNGNLFPNDKTKLDICDEHA